MKKFEDLNLDELLESEKKLDEFLLQVDSQEHWSQFEKVTIAEEILDEIKCQESLEKKKARKVWMLSGAAAIGFLSLVAHIYVMKSPVEKFAKSDDLESKVMLLQLMNASFNSETGDTPIYDL